MGVFTELQKLQLKFQLRALSFRKGVYIKLRFVFIQGSFDTYNFCCKYPKLGGECNSTLVVLVCVCLYVMTSILSPCCRTDSGGVITGCVRNYLAKKSN